MDENIIYNVVALVKEKVAYGRVFVFQDDRVIFYDGFGPVMSLLAFVGADRVAVMGHLREATILI